MPSYASLELEVLQKAGPYVDVNAIDAHECAHMLQSIVFAVGDAGDVATVRRLVGSQVRALILICAAYDINLTDALAESLKS